MVRKVSAYVTGSIVSGAVSLYERLVKHNVSLDTLYIGLGAFFVAGAFSAWREQYQAVKASNQRFYLREYLDAVAAKGEKLFKLWIAGKSPKYRSKRWLEHSAQFVSRHFKLEIYDWFKGETSPAEPFQFMKITMDTDKHKSKKVARDTALLIRCKLDVLYKLRDRIKDGDY